MKHIQLFESFKKNYKEKIKPSDFKEIELGKTVLYGGGSHKVIDNDGFILTLKDKGGKITKVNLNQFNDKGAINEARSIEKIEKDRSKVIGDMAVTVKDWKAAKESGDNRKEQDLLKKLKDLTSKKKNLETELNSKISDKDKDIQLVINEGLNNPKETTGKGLSDKVTSWFDWDTEYIDSGSQLKRAENTNNSVIKWFNEHPIAIKKDAFKRLEKLVATWGTGYTSKLNRFFGSSLNEAEESTKSFFDTWGDLYGENFIKEYPKLAKLIKMHPHVDARTLSKWWDEIYGEDFKKKYPAMWNRLNVKIKS